ncbi:MAG: hypothetical protein Sv326_0797 [Candidatus Fermentimicrarchaeum limneticum]|uniref:FAD-dependent oxidoreductase n=1 Tax=Fermentimicrarchaeum limneticum TaxID=2795018 RepID=A0A7D5XHV6_FERL1|nr:MAG: hypothetical protein Sv326_0797 [Candidatus Fermentimicrarchaeum limneticum]
MKAIVVGAGPAGLFCAYELAKAGVKVVVVDSGSTIERRKCPMKKMGYCVKCSPCNLIHGVGGAGLFSDGKLNLDPRIGGDMLQFMSESEARRLIDYVDRIFSEHGAKGERNIIDERAEALMRKAKMAGVRFLPIVQRHIGSDKLPEVIESLKGYMEALGVKFVLNKEVRDIAVSDGVARGVVARREVINGDFVVLATGRGGAQWLARKCMQLGVPTNYQPLDIGLRVEVPAEIMKEVTDIFWDPKFYIQTSQYDDSVRTFCTCPNGFVISESYNNFICTNGHSMVSIKSDNTNFALLVRIALTQPVENTSEYGESIGRISSTIGGGRPILQRFGDLKAGRRSTWERIKRSYVKPTFLYVTPGDVSMALPGRIMADIREALEMLNKVIPGVAEDSTLLYAPEIKFHALRVNVSKHMETNVKNLFAIGDGAGVSRGIVGASLSGIVAAREIAKRCRNG